MPAPINVLRDGVTQVTTAGTRVRLAEATGASPATGAVTIAVQALGTNTGAVVVGAVTCVAAAGTQGSATQRGIRLAANDSITFDATGLGAVYVDALNNGDGVSWVVGAA